MASDRGKARDLWPKAAEAEYQRVEILGQGNFGAVWLAKSKKNMDDPYGDGGGGGYVAVKNVDISKSSLKAYAAREIAVLREMKHPNIIHLVKAYNPTKKNPNCRLVVMSFANGPNLRDIVETGGALGLPLARLVSRDLVAAISYLHSRAVIHRDIKTDNCVLARIDVDPATHSKVIDDWKNDDIFWSDDSDCQHAVDAKKWRVVIVDFGMARALSPKDMGAKFTEKATKTKSDEEEDAQDTALLATANAFGGDVAHDPVQEEAPKKSMQRGSSRRRMQPRSESVSRVMIKRLSALGTYAFAAPEISDDYRKKSAEDCRRTNSLTKCIADYGLLADAYSLGRTLREILTGVPPGEENISKYVKKNQGDCSVLLASLGCFGKKRVKKIRNFDEIPTNAAMLINKLSEKEPKNRITVREAQTHPWIAGGVGEEKFQLAQGDVPSCHGAPVAYLKCATDGTFDKA